MTRCASASSIVLAAALMHAADGLYEVAGVGVGTRDLAGVCSRDEVGNGTMIDRYVCTGEHHGRFSGLPFQIALPPDMKEQESFKLKLSAVSPGSDIVVHYGGTDFDIEGGETSICFVQNRSRLDPTFTAINHGGAPHVKVNFTIEVQRRNWIPISTLESVGAVSPGGGSEHLLSISMPRDHHDIPSLYQFHINVSNLGGGVATIHVFNSSSRCVNFVRGSSCIPWRALLGCLRANAIGTNMRTHAHEGSPATSFTVSTNASFTLQKTQTRHESQWYVLATIETNASMLAQAEIGLSVTGESGVFLKLFMGGVFMLVVPLLALVAIDVLELSLAHWLTTEAQQGQSCLSKGWKLFLEDMRQWGRDCRRICVPGPTYAGLLVLAAGAYFTSGAQFAMVHWSQMLFSGNRDVCYYNERCYYPVYGTDFPFNNMLSHISYFICGAYVFFTVARVKVRWDNLFHGDAKPLDVRVFHALAFGLLFEGLGSMCYHLCPAMEVFQFDAAIMLPLSHLSLLALLQTEKDVEAATRGAAGSDSSEGLLDGTAVSAVPSLRFASPRAAAGSPPPSLDISSHRGVRGLDASQRGSPPPSLGAQGLDATGVDDAGANKRPLLRATTLAMDASATLRSDSGPFPITRNALSDGRARVLSFEQNTTVETAVDTVEGTLKGDTMPESRHPIIPLGYYLVILLPMWGFDFLGTWFDTLSSGSERNVTGTGYVVFILVVGVWAVVALKLLSRALPRGDWITVWILRLLIAAVMCVVLARPKLRWDLGGTANIVLGSSMFAMLLVTTRQMVVFDIRMNTCRSFSDVWKFASKYSVSITFVVLANVALLFFTDSVTDATVSASLSRALESDCVFLVFDAHDTWHLLSAISLALWIQTLLDMKFRIAKRVHNYSQFTSKRSNRGAESSMQPWPSERLDRAATVVAALS